MTTMISPVSGATAALHNEWQRSFRAQRANTGKNEPFDWLNLKRSEQPDYTFPLEVEFTWETDKGWSLFELADNHDFHDARRIQTTNKSLTLRNFLANHTYYWRVNGEEAFSFRTEDVAPRWMYVGGLSNVRDNGNWKTMDGRRTKQGLLFRGTEMDIHHNITDEGKWQMLEDLKIRTDLDLRGESIGSPLGDKVHFLNILGRPYDQFIDDKPKCKALFDAMAEKENYPIYLHCWGGADRTGSIFFVLNAMLGVEFEDLVHDYELTSLSIWGDRTRESDYFKSFMAALDRYGDETESVNIKAIRFLEDCGVDKAQQEKIKAILLSE